VHVLNFKNVPTFSESLLFMSEVPLCSVHLHVLENTTPHRSTSGDPAPWRHGGMSAACQFDLCIKSEGSYPDIEAKAPMAPTPIPRRARPGLWPTHNPCAVCSYMYLRTRPHIAPRVPPGARVYESGPLTVHLGMSTYHAISGRGISQSRPTGVPRS